jgi:hypothetical protein
MLSPVPPLTFHSQKYVDIDNQVDLRDIAAQLIETFDLMIARQNAYREGHGEHSIYDIQYGEQLRDPIGQMRKLYAHFDEPFTPQVQSAMQRLLADKPAGQARHSPIQPRGVWSDGRRRAAAF